MLTLNSGSKKHWKCKYKKHILCSLYLKKYLAGNYKIDKYIHFLRAAWFCHKILSQMLSFSKILVVFGTNYAKLHKNIQLVPHVLTAIENFLLLYHHVLSAILYRTNWITPPCSSTPSGCYRCHQLLVAPPQGSVAPAAPCTMSTCRLHAPGCFGLPAAYTWPPLDYLGW